MIGEYIAPSIKVIHNAIDYEDELILMVQGANIDKWRDSTIRGGGELDKGIRSSRDISVAYGLTTPRQFFHLAQDIFVCALDYSKENGFGFTHMEGISIIEYPANAGFYDRHVDAGPEFPRSMSALLYLNDVEEGGETWFDKFDLAIKPEAGKLVLFPSNYAYSHQALPPRSNDKYVAVTWFGQELSEDVFRSYYVHTRR